jgi:hypothetical protein
VRDRAWRLGVPYLVSVVVLMPIAYYPTFLRYHLPGTTDFNFLHFWWHTLTIGPWPSGPAWFLWVLLALDAMAAAVWLVAPRIIQALGQLIFSVRHRPMTAFVVFLIVSTAAYMPMHLGFGDTDWLELSRFPLPIQTSRILLYTAYFFAGISVGAISLRSGLLAENGELARRWPVSLPRGSSSDGTVVGLWSCRSSSSVRRIARWALPRNCCRAACRRARARGWRSSCPGRWAGGRGGGL